MLATTSLRFCTSGIYQMTADHSWKLVTGWIGVVLSAVAIYAALAAEVEAEGSCLLTRT